MFRDPIRDAQKLQHLCDLIRVQQELNIMDYVLQGYYNIDTEPARFTVTTKRAYKYIHIYIGYDRPAVGIKAHRYAVEIETGRIFFVEFSGRINRRRSYGTLDTVNLYSWGQYSAHRRFN